MFKQLRHDILQTLSFLFSDRLANRMARIFSRKFIEQVRTSATDEFLELLLGAMSLAFNLSRMYRKNIRDFTAKYVFATADGSVGTTARFENGKMYVDEHPADQWTARVQFANAAALRRFLLGQQSQDILNSILANEVQVSGNLNYVYKFSFMARSLDRRLGGEAS
jgi:hypothetical protein